jgi:hypothetical protein
MLSPLDGETPYFGGELIRAFYGLRLPLQKPSTGQIRGNAAIITVQIHRKTTLFIVGNSHFRKCSRS